MKIYWLEIVTPEVETHCQIYQNLYGVSFNLRPELGNAYVTEIPGHGQLGIRAPLHNDETPVVRPYVLVNDIENAVNMARQSGSTIIHAPLDIAGFGTFAIAETGGIQHGFVQV